MPSVKKSSLINVATMMVWLTVLLTVFVPGGPSLRAPQIAPLLLFVLCFGLLLPLRTDEAIMLTIAFALAALFLVNLLSFRQLHFVGFAPVSLVCTAILTRRCWESAPEAIAKVVGYSVLVLSTYVIARMVVVGTHPNNVLAITRNYAATALLASGCAALASSCYVGATDTVRLRAIASAVLAGFATISLTGRAGVVTGTALAFLALVHFFLQTRQVKARIAFLFFAPLAATFVTLTGLQVSETGTRDHVLSRFDERGLDSPRFEVWAELFSTSTSPQYWVGFPLGLSRQTTGHGTHSVWLTLVESYGLSGFVIGVAGSIAMILLALRRSWLIAGLLVLLAVRASFDDHPLTYFAGPMFFSLFLVARSGYRTADQKPTEHTISYHIRDPHKCT